MPTFRIIGTITRTFDFEVEIEADDPKAAEEAIELQDMWDNRIPQWSDHSDYDIDHIVLVPDERTEWSRPPDKSEG